LVWYIRVGFLSPWFRAGRSLLLASLFGGLGDLAGGGVLLGDGLDDADGDGLPHVTDGEATERRVVGESLHGHGLGRSHLNDSGISILDGLREGLKLLARTTIALLKDLLKLAGDVGGVAIHDRRISVLDFSRVVENNDLSVEVLALLGWVVLRVRGDVSTTNFLYGDVLDIEANVVTGKGLGKRLVVHLNRFDLSCDVGGSEIHNHTGLDDTSLNTTNGHCSNATDLVDILEWKTEGLVSGAGGGNNGVKGLNEGEATGISLLFGGLGPTLFLLAITVSAGPPGHLLRLLQHVVSMPSRDGAEDNLLGIVTNLLDVTLDFLADFQEAGLTVGSRSGAVHLVDTNNELLDTQGVGEEGVLTGLAILGDTSFKFTVASSDDEDSTISLGSASDHVLDEISVAWGINDGDVVVLCLELPQSDVNGDTTLTLSLEFVQNPGILEGALAHLLGLLLKLLNDTLVDTTAFVNEMASGSGLAGIDVSNDDNIDVQLFFTHFEGGLQSYVKFKQSKTMLL